MKLSGSASLRDYLLVVLRRHIGKSRGVTAKQLVAECNALIGFKAMTERDLRTEVTELRLLGHHVCAHPAAGYFVAQTCEELDETCRFLVDRAMSSLSQVARMKRVALPDLHGQFRLQL